MTSRAAVDGLLDHAIAKARALDRLELVAWFAVDTLLDVEEACRKWGPIPAPQPELAVLVAAIRHAIELWQDPPTPGAGAVEGEAVAPVLGQATDIACDDDISGAFADLKLTDDEDGRP